MNFLDQSRRMNPQEGFQLPSYGPQDPLGSGTFSMPQLMPGLSPSLSNFGQGSDLSFGLMPQTSPMMGGGGGWMDSFLGSKGQPGIGQLGLSALGGLASTWMGMKQYGLAKQSLAESKRQFDMDYQAQKGLTNSRLEDRQLARVASNPDAYESAASYMQKYGIK